MYVHVPASAQRRSPPAKSRAHSLPARSISCSAERLGLPEGVDPVGFDSSSIDAVVLGSAVSLSEERKCVYTRNDEQYGNPPDKEPSPAGWMPHR
jgi:hypothetical protein